MQEVAESDWLPKKIQRIFWAQKTRGFLGFQSSSYPIAASCEVS